MKEPFLYQGSEPIPWSFSQLAQLVDDCKQMECLADLVAVADQEGMTVHLPPETVNFVN